MGPARERGRRKAEALSFSLLVFEAEPEAADEGREAEGEAVACGLCFSPVFYKVHTVYANYVCRSLCTHTCILTRVSVYT